MNLKSAPNTVMEILNLKNKEVFCFEIVSGNMLFIVSQERNKIGYSATFEN